MFNMWDLKRFLSTPDRMFASLLIYMQKGFHSDLRLTNSPLIRLIEAFFLPRSFIYLTILRTIVKFTLFTLPHLIDLYRSI